MIVNAWLHSSAFEQLEPCFITVAFVSVGARVTVLRQCVAGLVGPVQSLVHSVVVLALGEAPDQEKVFVAAAEQGEAQLLNLQVLKR